MGESRVTAGGSVSSTPNSIQCLSSLRALPVIELG
jgi:hypothetical protein